MTSRNGYVLKLSNSTVVFQRVSNNCALPVHFTTQEETVVGLPEDLPLGLHKAKVTYVGGKFVVEVKEAVRLDKELARLDKLADRGVHYHSTKMPGIKGFAQKERLINAAADESKQTTRRLADALRSYLQA